jgi:heme/copper-type cytochrome/quinol oxidase subunit 3
MIQRKKAIQWERITLALGLVFLIGQGMEWGRLLQYGLTVEIGPYGFTFYTLVGFHALHVIGALLWRSAHVLRIFRFGGKVYRDPDLSRMYWYFVVGLWPVLYDLVYL